MSHVRADLQTPGASSQPLVFAAGGVGVMGHSRGGGGAFRGGAFNRGRGAGRPALAAKLVVVKHRQRQLLADDTTVAGGAGGGRGGGWQVQSAAVDTAPMTLDLQEELLLALPHVARGLSRPFAAVAVAVSSTPDATTSAAAAAHSTTTAGAFITCLHPSTSSRLISAVLKPLYYYGRDHVNCRLNSQVKRN